MKKSGKFTEFGAVGFKWMLHGSFSYNTKDMDVDQILCGPLWTVEGALTTV